MTRQFGMYTYRIRGKRGPFKIILPDSFCSFLTPPGMSGSPPSFSDYLYFYSFMNRKIHAHFHWQPISIVRYCSFSFFREDYAETVIVLFLIFRIGLFNNICPYCLPVCPPATCRQLPKESLTKWQCQCLSGFLRVFQDLKSGAHPYLPYNLAVCSCIDIIYIRFSVTYFLYSFHFAWSFLFSWERALPEKFHFFP